MGTRLVYEVYPPLFSAFSQTLDRSWLRLPPSWCAFGHLSAVFAALVLSFLPPLRD
jgi:hypothetical protein